MLRLILALPNFLSFRLLPPPSKLTIAIKFFSSLQPPLLSPSSTCKNPCYYIGSTLRIQDNLPIRKSADWQTILSASLILLCHEA